MLKSEDIQQLASLLRKRNETEEHISAITGRPASIGHLGEFIASRIFGIELATDANHKSIDGWFREGPFAERSVNVKWYARQEGLLDLCVVDPPDYYLVLCGPGRRWVAQAAHSPG